MTRNSARPNILWICTDQQRRDTLGCYGNPFTRTPNIDALAAAGVLFDYAYCQNPVCTPSRASFLTGRYPSTTRCRNNGQSIPADEVLVTRLLAEAGYTCGLAGKLHLSACHRSVCKDTERRINDGYQTFHWSHHHAPSGQQNQYVNWLRAQGKELQTQPFADCAYVRLGMPEPFHQTTWCADRAIDFITAQANQENPWLFSVNIYDPHHPFDPPEQYLERYRAILNDIPLPSFVPGELQDKPAWQQESHDGARGPAKEFPFTRMTESDHRWLRAAYWAMCDLIDVQVGRLMEALDRTGQRENTIVIFMADHGEMLGDHGIYLKGPFFYDQLVRIPLIISYPGMAQRGERSRALVELVDLAPTLMEAGGLSPALGMQGRSLWPLLQGCAPLHEHRSDVYCEMHASFHPGDQRPHADMVRTAEYKIAVEHGQNTGELYDMSADPAETHNLWNNPAYLDVKAEMLLRLTNRQAFTCDPLPPHLAPW